MNRLTTRYLVYAAKHNDEIVYIGSGANGREKHCASGCSHSYGLNRLHFANKSIEVVVLARLNSKEDSLHLETQLIAKYNPAFNLTNKPVKSTCEVYEKWHDYLLENSEPRKYIRFKEVLKSLINYFGVDKLTSGKGIKLNDFKNEHIPSDINYFIYCKKANRAKDIGYIDYTAYAELYDVLCKEKGFIKLPVTPVLAIKLSEKETHELINT